MHIAALVPFLSIPLALTAPAIVRAAGPPIQPPISTDKSTWPTTVGLLVFPGFQALDVFGPMDVLNSFNLIYRNYTQQNLAIISTTMEPVSTIVKRSAAMPMDHGIFGQSIVPTVTIKEVLAKQGKVSFPGPMGGPAVEHQIEVLIVPGGGGTRVGLLEEIELVKTLYPKLKYIISVCTGSTILARAGILDGRKATSNKRAWPWATSTGPKVNWVHKARWVEDGNIWTSSGVSAGIDVTFAWVSHVYGDDVAEYVSFGSEYTRWMDANNDPFAGIWNPELE
ncbi:class I glutamine amidotransferase-like protein [Amniculicola lignicola CBS 123094]|uniref:Class I glutamine amidotransferase-like protein n=1 Tax=Amniculicola lignicola CBS 123094 TaxID=1392246 RepID=A0A6A5W7H7_9PLEO|nr:class I glutamine amidotransferase-like protein [Amniculicola lignicola CBS 123094]